MNSTTKRALVAASVAGLLAAAGSVFSPAAQAEHEHGHGGDGKVSCYGINKCKGTGDCGGKGTSCAGSNACKGQGFIQLSEKDCLRIEGGRLTADAS